MKMKLMLWTCIVAVGLAGCGKSAEPANTVANNAAPTSSPAVESKAKTDDGVKITKEKYEKIENGMSLEEVIKIVGGPGETVAEVGKKGDDIHFISYMYKGVGDPGATANFAFENGTLKGKGQMGLK